MKSHCKQYQPSRANATIQQGFTLVELLVIVTIIALLTGVVMLSVYDSTNNANRAAAEAELKDISTAIIRLAGDTGKFPNGCPAGAVSNPEIVLNDTTAAGIVAEPSVGGSGSCQWRAEDVERWNGPYYEGDLIDPWGNPYWLDPDYTPYANCDELADQPTIPAIVSTGPRGGSVNNYGCEHVFLELR